MGPMEGQPTSDFVTAFPVNHIKTHSNGVRLRNPILGYGFRHLSFVRLGWTRCSNAALGSSPHSICWQMHILTALVYFRVRGRGEAPLCNGRMCLMRRLFELEGRLEKGSMTDAVRTHTSSDVILGSTISQQCGFSPSGCPADNPLRAADSRTHARLVAQAAR